MCYYLKQDSLAQYYSAKPRQERKKTELILNILMQRVEIIFQFAYGTIWVSSLNVLGNNTPPS